MLVSEYIARMPKRMYLSSKKVCAKSIYISSARKTRNKTSHSPKYIRVKRAKSLPGCRKVIIVQCNFQIDLVSIMS